MKISLIILLALVCAGCGPRTGNHESRFIDPIVFRDTLTGCEYLASGIAGEITPRIDIDGLSHRGCRKTDRVSP